MFCLSYNPIRGVFKSEPTLFFHSDFLASEIMYHRVQIIAEFYNFKSKKWQDRFVENHSGSLYINWEIQVFFLRLLSHKFLAWQNVSRKNELK